VLKNICNYYHLSVLKTVVLLNVFVETDTFFIILWWIESWKEQHFIEIEIFCIIINVNTVTFDQFNASLLNNVFFNLTVSILLNSMLPIQFTFMCIALFTIHIVSRQLYIKCMCIHYNLEWSVIRGDCVSSDSSVFQKSTYRYTDHTVS